MTSGGKLKNDLWRIINKWLMEDNQNMTSGGS